METTKEIAADIGVKGACQVVGTPRSSYYQHYHKYQKRKDNVVVRRTPVWALSQEERTEVLEVLHNPMFIDKAPHQAYATLLDEGRFLCSIRTMYRVLH